MFGKKKPVTPSKQTTSDKLKEMERRKQIIEQRRIERMEKAKERERLVRTLKLEKVKSLESLSTGKMTKTKSFNDVRKPPQKVPVIRQTLTSKKRIDIANLNLPEYKAVRDMIKSKSIVHNENNTTHEEATVPVQNINDLKKNKVHQLLAVEKNIARVSITNNQESELNKRRRKWGSPKPLIINSPSDEVLIASNNKITELKETMQSGHLRRSLSTIHRKRMSIDEAQKCIRRSQSMRTLPTPSSMRSIREEQTNPMDETFPKTPNRSTQQKGGIPKPAELQKRLIKWLQSHGKPLGTFKNLHTFGVKQVYCSSSKHNKENIPIIKGGEGSSTAAPDLNETFDKVCEEKKMFIHSTPVMDDINDKVDCLKVAEDALNDLYILILDGYPREQCQEWLKVIISQHSSLKSLPIYWECKAILQCNEGDFRSAIDSYQKAVIQGAEHLSIENKLSSLFDKLCDLNVDMKTLNAPGFSNVSIDCSNDAENKDKFTSTIIKFAVRQKKKTKSDEDPSYIATPVRRSSRLWAKTPLSTTPFQSVQYCNTLNSLDDKIRKSIRFTPNTALDTP